MKDRPVQQVHPGRKAMRVPKVPLDRRVLLESPDLQDLQDQQGKLDPQDQQDHLARLAQKGQRAIPANPNSCGTGAVADVRLIGSYGRAA